MHPPIQAAPPPPQIIGVHAGVPGVHRPDVRAKVGVVKSEIQVNSYEIRAKFLRILCEFARIAVYSEPTGLPGFCTFSFWVPFDRGGCFWGGSFSG